MYCCSRLELTRTKGVPLISKVAFFSYSSRCSLIHCVSTGWLLHLKLSLHKANLIQDFNWPHVFFLLFNTFLFFFQLRLVHFSHNICITRNLSVSQILSEGHKESRCKYRNSCHVLKSLASFLTRELLCKAWISVILSSKPLVWQAEVLWNTSQLLLKICSKHFLSF